MIVLDRSVDWLTPMCTQWTYEGLVDEVVGIKSCTIILFFAIIHVRSPFLMTPFLLLRQLMSRLQNRQPRPIWMEHRLLVQAPLQPRRTRRRSTSSTRLTKSSTRFETCPSARLDRDSTASPNASKMPIHRVVAGRTLLRSRTLSASSVDCSRSIRHSLCTRPCRRPSFSLLTAKNSTPQWKFNKVCSLSFPLFDKPMGDTNLQNLLLRWQDLIAGDDLTKQQSAIDDLISQGLPLNTVLRLLIILSLTAGGLKPKVFDAVRRELLQVSC